VRRGNYEDQEGAHARLLAATIDGIKVVIVYIPNGQAGPARRSLSSNLIG
jgi:exonuclease III